MVDPQPTGVCEEVLTVIVGHGDEVHAGSEARLVIIKEVPVLSISLTGKVVGAGILVPVAKVVHVVTVTAHPAGVEQAAIKGGVAGRQALQSCVVVWFCHE